MWGLGTESPVETFAAFNINADLTCSRLKLVFLALWKKHSHLSIFGAIESHRSVQSQRAQSCTWRSCLKSNIRNLFRDFRRFSSEWQFPCTDDHRDWQNFNSVIFCLLFWLFLPWRCIRQWTDWHVKTLPIHTVRSGDKRPETETCESKRGRDLKIITAEFELHEMWSRVETRSSTWAEFRNSTTVTAAKYQPAVSIVAIGNPERHMRKASHRGSKQQESSHAMITLHVRYCYVQSLTSLVSPEITRHDHSIIAYSRHIYVWYCSSRTSRSWWITQSTQHHRSGCNSSNVADDPA